MKVGDRVKVIGNAKPDWTNYIGRIGSVAQWLPRDEDGQWLQVILDRAEDGCGYAGPMSFVESELEILEATDAQVER